MELKQVPVHRNIGSFSVQEVSEHVYRILVRYSSCVQPLSCDEALMDVTGLTDDPGHMAAQIRADIEKTTGCTASAGGVEWRCGTQVVMITGGVESIWSLPLN